MAKTRVTIPNDRLRESFLASHMSATDIALFAGFTRTDKKTGNVFGDSVKLMRSLGLLAAYGKKGDRRYYKTVTEENALAIAKALNLDPVDIGI